MSKDKIEVNMNVYDIPILVEALEEANKEIERLNNKLSLIKGIIRTPRALDKSLAYAMVKTQIENVLGSDKE